VLAQRSVLARGAVRRVTALAGVLAFSLPVGLTASTASAFVLAAPADEEARLNEAKTLYDEGLAYFETHDYKAAVDKWTQAYAKLPETATGQRNAMVYNIATAQEKAYEIDHDLQHLRQALLLLESYVKNYKAMYKKTPETKAEVDKANTRIQALRDRIAAAESGQAPAPAPAPAPGLSDAADGHVDGIQWSSGHAPPVDQDKLKYNRMLAERVEKADHMLIGSYVLFSVGGVFFLGGLAATGVGGASSSRRALYGGVGALSFGLACVAAGGALLGVGLTRKKKLSRGEMVFSPAVGPSFAGAAVGGRF
jgi:hypothetical protein